MNYYNILNNQLCKLIDTIWNYRKLFPNIKKILYIYIYIYIYIY